jgi:Protein of unknown function (DUF1566)
MTSKSSHVSLIRSALLSALLFSAAAAHAACPTSPTASRFTLNGAEVLDQQTGLTWSRCSVGQSWDGSTCTGIASTMGHQDALTHAKSQSGWRLPNVKELASLMDLSCVNPAIDSVAFPATPAGNFWTATMSTWGNNAWSVGFYSGGSNVPVYANNYFYVRLVRVGP